MAGGVAAMKVLEHALAMDRVRLAALQAKAQAPTVAAIKASTLAAIQNVRVQLIQQGCQILGLDWWR